MQLREKSVNDVVTRNSTNIFLLCCEEDYQQYLDIVAEFLYRHGSYALFYYSDIEDSYDKETIENTLLAARYVIAAITNNFINNINGYINDSISIANENSIPIIPLIMSEAVKDNIAVLTNLWGKVQYINFYKDPSIKIDSLYQDHNSSINQQIVDNFASNVFISYRKKNRAQLNSLYNSLSSDSRMFGVGFWFDDFLTPGERYDKEILESIDECDIFLILATEDILEDDNYVLRVEYPYAAERGKSILVYSPNVITNPETIKSTFNVANHVFYDINELIDYLHDLSAQRISIIKQENFYYLLGLAYKYGIRVKQNIHSSIDCFNRDMNDRSLYELMVIYSDNYYGLQDLDKVINLLNYKTDKLKMVFGPLPFNEFWNNLLAYCSLRIETAKYVLRTKAIDEALPILMEIHRLLERQLPIYMNSLKDNYLFGSSFVFYLSNANQTLGNYYRLKKDYDTALHYFNNAIMLNKVLGIHHKMNFAASRDTMTCIIDMADTYLCSSNIDKSEEYYLSALDICNTILQHDADDVLLDDIIVIYQKLGLLYEIKKQPKQSMSFYFKALNSVLNTKPNPQYPNRETRVFTAVNLVYDFSKREYLLALDYYKTNNTSQSLEHMKLATDSLEQVYSMSELSRYEHESIVLLHQCYFRMGWFSSLTNDYETSEKYYLRAIGLQDSVLDQRLLLDVYTTVDCYCGLCSTFQKTNHTSEDILNHYNLGISLCNKYDNIPILYFCKSKIYTEISLFYERNYEKPAKINHFIELAYQSMIDGVCKYPNIQDEQNSDYFMYINNVIKTTYKNVLYIGLSDRIKEINKTIEQAINGDIEANKNNLMVMYDLFIKTDKLHSTTDILLSNYRMHIAVCKSILQDATTDNYTEYLDVFNNMISTIQSCISNNMYIDIEYNTIIQKYTDMLITNSHDYRLAFSLIDMYLSLGKNSLDINNIQDSISSYGLGLHLVNKISSLDSESLVYLKSHYWDDISNGIYKLTDKLADNDHQTITIVEFEKEYAEVKQHLRRDLAFNIDFNMICSHINQLIRDNKTIDLQNQNNYLYSLFIDNGTRLSISHYNKYTNILNKQYLLYSSKGMNTEAISNLKTEIELRLRIIRNEIALANDYICLFYIESLLNCYIHLHEIDNNHYSIDNCAYDLFSLISDLESYNPSMKSIEIYNKIISCICILGTQKEIEKAIIFINKRFIKYLTKNAKNFNGYVDSYFYEAHINLSNSYKKKGNILMATLEANKANKYL